MQLNSQGQIVQTRQTILKPYQAREPLPVTLLSDSELLNNTERDIILDVETYQNYFLIGMKALWCNKYLRFEISGEFNNLKLSWILHNYRTIGFNSLKYDLLLIWLSYYQQDLNKLKVLSDRIVFDNYWPKSFEEDYGYKIPRTNHIDLIEVAPLKGSLKLYGARIHAPRLQDLPFSVDKPLTSKQIEIVQDYNINDLDTTEILFNFMKERIELRTAISIEYQEDLMSKSDAQIAEAIITKKLRETTGKWPKRPDIDPGTTYHYNIPTYIQYQTKVLKDVLEVVKQTKFVVAGDGGINMPPELAKLVIPINGNAYKLGIGGLHSTEECITYKSNETGQIFDRDVASYYPRIILNQGLCPEHIGKEFLIVYNGIVERRLEAKKNKRYTEDKGLKIVINGSFGKLGSMWSKLYAPNLMIGVTVTGQLSLLMMIEAFEFVGISVISANTDGVVCYCPNNKMSMYEEIVKWWEQTTAFQTEETRYSAYYARDVNNYFAVKEADAKGEIKVKIKGGYSEIGSQSGTQLDTNPTSLICSDAVEKLLSLGVPIEKTIQECSNFSRFVTVRNVKGGAHKDGNYLGKVIRWYYAKGELGTINYILTGNKVPKTEGAKPCMDMPAEFPLDVDYEWYVNKSVDILYEIGYLKKAKQERLI